MSQLLKMLASVLSPGGRRGRLAILIYHGVLPEPDPLLPGVPDKVQFRSQMQAVGEVFNVLPLSQAVARMRENDLPPRAVAITFDDGYANNAEIAMPVLSSLGLCATFFVATGYLDGGRMFNDSVVEIVRRANQDVLDTGPLGLGELPMQDGGQRRAAIQKVLPVLKYLEPERRNEYVEGLCAAAGVELPDNLMMSSEQVRSLASAGMEVGAHTVHHPILARIDAETALGEIERSRIHLEAILQQPVRLFAYPNGRPRDDYTQEHVRMVRELGFDAAVSTAWGVSHRNNDFMQLPRITPWDPQPAAFCRRLVINHLRRHSDSV